MSEHNENRIEETIPKKMDIQENFPISSQNGLGEVKDALEHVNDLVLHDKIFTSEDVEKLSVAFENAKINVGGEEFTLREMMKLAEDNSPLWQKIEKGEIPYDRVSDFHSQITFLTPHFAKLLVEQSSRIANLWLNNLKTLPTGVAKELGKFKKGAIMLSSVTHLSDEAAEALIPEEGGEFHLSFLKLKEISPNALRSLCKIKGPLTLGVKEISDEMAEIFVTHEGKIYFTWLESVSDSALKILSASKKQFSFPDPISTRFWKIYDANRSNE